jgi:hypothetical protein
MITNQDRSGWFGASDTHFITGNWDTKTFKSWWLEKLGLKTNKITTKAMRVGTHYEHRILDTISGVRKDHQIIVKELLLRVNYDGDKDGTIYEVKTYKGKFSVTKAYWQQAQVEMFAMNTKDLYIVSYQLTDSDYKNFFNEIDPERIGYHKIEYSEDFIREYLQDLKVLRKCLLDGALPRREE